MGLNVITFSLYNDCLLLQPLRKKNREDKPRRENQLKKKKIWKIKMELSLFVVLSFASLSVLHPFPLFSSCVSHASPRPINIPLLLHQSPSKGKKMAKEVRMKEEPVPMAKAEDQKFSGLVEDDADRKKRVVFGGGSAKRASAGGSVLRCCQAEKCPADLNEAKQYHRRHKVCEHHSKAQIVVVAGIKQRFCQQCSKFHEVSEFDETKRSCRKRLAGHNERRRKYPSEANSDGCSRKVEDGCRMETAMQGKHGDQ